MNLRNLKPFRWGWSRYMAQWREIWADPKSGARLLHLLGRGRPGSQWEWRHTRAANGGGRVTEYECKHPSGEDPSCPVCKWEISERRRR